MAAVRNLDDRKIAISLRTFDRFRDEILYGYAYLDSGPYELCKKNLILKNPRRQTAAISRTVNRHFHDDDFCRKQFLVVGMTTSWALTFIDGVSGQCAEVHHVLVVDVEETDGR